MSGSALALSARLKLTDQPLTQLSTQAQPHYARASKNAAMRTNSPNHGITHQRESLYRYPTYRVSVAKHVLDDYVIKATRTSKRVHFFPAKPLQARLCTRTHRPATSSNSRSPSRATALSWRHQSERLTAFQHVLDEKNASVRLRN